MTYEDKLLKKLINIFNDYKPTHGMFYDDNPIIRQKASHISNRISIMIIDDSLILNISDDDKHHLLSEITLFLDFIIRTYDDGVNTDDWYYIYKPKFDIDYIKGIVNKSFQQINLKNKLNMENQLILKIKSHQDILWNKIVNTIIEENNNKYDKITKAVKTEDLLFSINTIFDYVNDLVDYEKVDQLTTELINKKLKET